MSSRRFDAVIFDAGGVLVLPDPLVLGPLLAYYGADGSVETHARAHYAAMKAKADADSAEGSWEVYDEVYVAAVGVAGADADEAAQLRDGAVYIGYTETCEEDPVFSAMLAALLTILLQSSTIALAVLIGVSTAVDFSFEFA